MKTENKMDRFTRIEILFAHTPIWGILLSGLFVAGLAYWQGTWDWLSNSLRWVCISGNFALFLFGLSLSQRLSPPSPSHMNDCSYAYNKKTTKSQNSSPSYVAKNEGHEA